MARKPRSSSRRQQGYLLLFVTLTLAVLALVASRLALRVDSLRRQALDLSEQVEAERLVANARAQALVRVATRPLGRASLGFLDEAGIRIDGRWYRSKEGALLALQDERGLMSLNEPQREPMRQLLIRLGAAPDEADALIDVLLDYADSDSSPRLQGAERNDYANAGLPPPRDDWIRSVDELARMPRWQRLPALRSGVSELSGVRRQELLNPNTAPSAVLSALAPTVTEEQWQLFRTLREQTPFADADAVLQLTGIRFEAAAGGKLLFYASNTLRLRVWAEGLPEAHEYNLVLLPTAEKSPWLIHEVRRAPRPDPQHAALAAPLPVATVPAAARTPRSPEP